MRRRKKPEYKYPCLKCKNPVKKTHLGLACDTCEKWIHVKCTDLTDAQYDLLETNEHTLPFYCLSCKPRLHYADLILDNTTPSTSYLDSSSSFSSSGSDGEFSPAHDSDFEYVDESDSDDCRGLDFSSIPVGTNINPNHANRRKPLNENNSILMRKRNYKYPCVSCDGREHGCSDIKHFQPQRMSNRRPRLCVRPRQLE